jgi:hypothetical protein
MSCLQGELRVCRSVSVAVDCCAIACPLRSVRAARVLVVKCFFVAAFALALAADRALRLQPPPWDMCALLEVGRLTEFRICTVATPSALASASYLHGAATALVIALDAFACVWSASTAI